MVLFCFGGTKKKLERCTTCNESMWKQNMGGDKELSQRSKRKLAKVLWRFPLKTG
jgi:hypothetical protein